VELWKTFATPSSCVSFLEKMCLKLETGTLRHHVNVGGCSVSFAWGIEALLRGGPEEQSGAQSFAGVTQRTHVRSRDFEDI